MNAHSRGKLAVVIVYKRPRSRFMFLARLYTKPMSERKLKRFVERRSFIDYLGFEIAIMSNIITQKMLSIYYGSNLPDMMICCTCDNTLS